MSRCIAKRRLSFTVSNPGICKIFHPILRASMKNYLIWRFHYESFPSQKLTSVSSYNLEHHLIIVEIYKNERSDTLMRVLSQKYLKTDVRCSLLTDCTISLSIPNKKTSKTFMRRLESNSFIMKLLLFKKTDPENFP